MVGRGVGEHHEPLGVGDQLGGVDRIFDVLDGQLRIHVDRGAGEHVVGSAAGVHEGGHHPRSDGFGDEHHRLAQLHGGDDRPLAGALLAGGVEDDVDHGRAVVVGGGQDLGGDLDQVGLEAALVPAGEDLGHLGGSHPHGGQGDGGLGEHLHVAVLDPVVDHLDVVPGPARADPVAAGLVAARTRLRRDRLEHLLDVGPGVVGSAGHDRGAVAGALLAAGDPRTDIAEALLLESGEPATGVGVERVAPVDEDVAVVEERNQIVDHGVDNRARLHQQDDLPGK